MPTKTATRLYALIQANQAYIPIRTLCRYLNVAKSGYYDWQTRKPCQRTLANRVMTERIRAIHARSDASYGMPRIHAELRDMGEIISKKRVARLMRLARIQGVSRRRGFVVTTQRDLRQKAAPDLVQRQFVASGINQLWVADMTYVPTWAGFLYLAVVMDVFSRKVVGWAFGERMTSNLVIAALNMALATRRPETVAHFAERDRGFRVIVTAGGMLDG